MNNVAVKLKNISKVYKLYDKPIDRLKETISIQRKKYHKKYQVLDNISFDIKKGETVGIIGTNGSGKSTLLKIITGVLTQTYGEVYVDGKVSALLELGAGFNPEYTGIENIYLNGNMMGYTRDEIDKKLETIISFADIGEFINQPVKNYSSGMFARLAFAVAINVEPDVLIVDEALSVGDVYFQAKCYNHIKQEMKKTTNLIVSHDLITMSKLCEKIIVIDKGNLKFFGDTLTGISYYHKINQGIYNEENSICKETKYSNFKNIDAKFININADSISGKFEAIVDSYYYIVDEIQFSNQIETDNILSITISVKSNRNIDDVILGYIVKDKYGNDIFGENTLSKNNENINLKKGKNLIAFKIKWPQIKEGDYFITIGIGEGKDVINQKVQCWAHNIFHLESKTRGTIIYGIFNNEILSIHNESLGECNEG